MLIIEPQQTEAAKAPQVGGWALIRGDVIVIKLSVVWLLR
jgi:hypothetical protein